MTEFFVVIVFVLSFVLIFWGAELMVDSAIWLSKATGISPIIVGATFVSVATTLPETSISILAVRHGDTILSTSNAFGSMICNFALILGMAFTVMPSPVDMKGFKSKCFFLALSFILLGFFSIDKVLSVAEASILLGIFVLFIIFSIVEAKKLQEIDSKYFEGKDFHPAWIMILQFFIGALAIAYGSQILVSRTQIIGDILKLDSKVLGLSVVALGTGLPEIVTTISSVRKKNAGIGVGNMLGANIFNSTLLFGLCGIFADGNLLMSKQVYIEFLFLGLLIIISIFPIIFTGKSSRKQGILLLSLYVIYNLVLFFFR